MYPTIHLPGEEVVDSGIYDVVDKHGTYLNHQEVCVEGKRRTFPELGDPRAYGYVLHTKTRHMDWPDRVFVPGQRVPFSGIYEVVDEQGKSLDHQKTCLESTPDAVSVFPPIKEVPHGHGYALVERATYPPR